MDAFSNEFYKDPKAMENYLSKSFKTLEISATGSLTTVEFLVLMVKSQGVNGIHEAFWRFT